MYKRICRKLRETPSDWYDAELHYEAADAIEDLIAALAASNEVIAKGKHRWIPVTEQLPERGQNVLVANQRGKQWDIDKAWLSCLGSGFDRCGKRSLYQVTHWMPLPEPPKEES